MVIAGHIRLGHLAATVMLAAAVCGLGGCSLFVPSRADVAAQQAVEPALGGDSLVQEGVLTVAFNTADAPEGITRSDGTVTGFHADLAAALAQRLGLKVAIVNAGGASSVLSEGRADIFLGAPTSDEDPSMTVFGDCSEDATALFARDGEGRTFSVSDLASMTIGVQESSAAQDSLGMAGIAAQQSTYANVNECFEALASGEVDCVACDATSGAYLARAYEGVGFVGTIGEVSVLGVAADASDTDLISAVRDALEAMASDGTLSAIHATWFGTLPSTLADHMLSGVTVTSSETDGPSDDTADGGDDTGIMLLDGVDINELGANS